MLAERALDLALELIIGEPVQRAGQDGRRTRRELTPATDLVGDLLGLASSEENLPPGLPWRAAARPRATEAGAERLVLRLQLGGGDHEAWSQAAAIEARRTDAAEARGRSRMAAVEKAGDVDAALDTVEHPRKVVVDEQRAAREVDGTERLVLGAVRAALFVAVG